MPAIVPAVELALKPAMNSQFKLAVKLALKSAPRERFKPATQQQSRIQINT